MKTYKFIINTGYIPARSDWMKESNFLKDFKAFMDDHMYGNTERYGCYARTATWSIKKEHGYYWFETNDSYLYRNLYTNYRIHPNCYEKFEQQILRNADLEAA